MGTVTITSADLYAAAQYGSISGRFSTSGTNLRNEFDGGAVFADGRAFYSTTVVIHDPPFGDIYAHAQTAVMLYYGANYVDERGQLVTELAEVSDAVWPRVCGWCGNHECWVSRGALAAHRQQRSCAAPAVRVSAKLREKAKLVEYWPGQAPTRGKTPVAATAPWEKRSEPKPLSTLRAISKVEIDLSVSRVYWLVGVAYPLSTAVEMLKIVETVLGSQELTAALLSLANLGASKASVVAFLEANTR